MDLIREYTFGFNCGKATLDKPWDHYHRHNEIEINFVDQGSYFLEIQGHRVQVDPGKLLIFWGGIPHFIHTDSVEQTHYWLCVPVASFFQWVNNPKLFPKIFSGGLILSDFDRYLKAFSYLFQFWGEDLANNSKSIRDSAQLAICAQIRCTLEEIGQRYRKGLLSREIESQSKQPGMGNKLIQQICEYIVENYLDENLDVSIIAEYVGAHPKYIISLFKKKFGMSINEFMLFLRVSEAQKMIIHTDRKITDIALDCGFSTLSSFYAAFQKLVGTKPLNLRPNKKSTIIA